MAGKEAGKIDRGPDRRSQFIQQVLIANLLFEAKFWEHQSEPMTHPHRIQYPETTSYETLTGTRIE